MRLFRGTCFVILAALAVACGHKAQVAAPRAPQPPRPAAAPQTPAPKPSTPSSAGSRQPTPSPVVPPSLPSAAENHIPTQVVVPGPAIRIGLTTTAKEIRVSGSGDFYVMEKMPESARAAVHGDLVIRIEREVEESSDIFRVQVASYTRSDSAEELRQRLGDQFSVPALVRDNPNGGTHQVRIGAFGTRAEAQQFASGPLADAGYRDTLVVRENTSAGGSAIKVALRGPDNQFRISRTGYLFFPGSNTALLRLNGKPYRGILDLMLNKNDRITVVNQLGVEEYLLGVVPAEISPTSYPEPAALAAQAIAARTYALKNMGRFRSEGYDLTSDVRTQVYGGESEEKPATTEVVRNTFGVAIYYQGSLIDAMYSSTCGGRTEDFSNVFDGPPVPYLKGVLCAVETDAGDLISTTIHGEHALQDTVFSDDGSPANREAELGLVLGLMPASQTSSAFMSAPLSRSEAHDWVSRTIELARRTEPAEQAFAGDCLSRASFLACAASRLIGGREVGRRISQADADYYLANLKDGDQIPPPARTFVAFLMQAGLWRPFPDNTLRPGEPMRRLDALNLLLRWIESGRNGLLRTGNFIGPAGTSERNGTSQPAITVKNGSRTENFPLAADLRLFRVAAGRSIPARDLRIIGNEKLSFHVGADGKIDFLEVELNPTGAASDRYSPVATWQSTLSRAALAEKLRPVAANVGEIRDIKPARYGTSGRAVQIEIVGSRGSTVLNGYKVRNALGLKDTLFTISRTQNADGSIESFTFDGRGWGHGVGLCQVGAFGMARSGRSTEEILRTYYQGVEIRRAY